MAAACSLPLTEAQQQADSTTTTTSPPAEGAPPTTAPRPTPTLPPLDPDDAEVLAQLQGQLVVGLGPLVALVNPDGSAGRLVGGGDGVIATQPTWSPEGTLLAWSEATPNATAVTVFDPASGGSLTSEMDGPPAFYLQWTDSEQLLGYLRNDPSGAGIEAGALRAGEAPVVFDLGAPYFFDWAPEREFWVSLVRSEQLALVSSDEVIPLPEQLGEFSVPQWVDDDRFAYVGPNGIELFDLTGVAGQSFPVAPGAIAFTVSPTGAHIALVEPETDAGPAALRIIDVATGEVSTVTEEPVVVWEWSPDGNRLLWTGLDTADAANLAQIHVWSVVEQREESVTPSFRPSDLLIRAYFPFFTQYAVSHTTWSPDSTAFAFAGSIQGDSGIWIHALPTEERDGVDAARISVGDVAFWSPNEAQPPAAAPAPF